MARFSLALVLVSAFLMLLPHPAAQARDIPTAVVAEEKVPQEDACGKLFAKLVRYYDANPGTPYVYARPSDVSPCAQSVAFDQQRDLGTLQSITNYFKSFYGLLHVAMKSPSPELPSKYDIVAALEAVYAKPWSTAEDFYVAVARAVDGLNDGHTSLDLSCPPFLHRLALPIVGVLEGGVPTVYTTPKPLLKPVFQNISTQAPFNFDPAEYVGAKVVAINGQPAWEFVQKFAEGAGSYHDQGQRTNYAFARLAWNNGTRISSYGAFGIRVYHPKADFVTMTIIKPGSEEQEIVKVPFISYSPSSNLPGLRTEATYYDTFCSVSNAVTLQKKADSSSEADTDSPTAAPPQPVVSPIRVGRIRGLPKRFAVHKEDELPLPLAGGQDVTPEGGYWKVYKLADGKTGVVTISTFMPDIPMDSDLAFVASYYWVVNETVKAFATANKFASQIFLDVSGNGGGVTTYVPLVIELLLGTDKFAGPGKMRLNPINTLADTDVVRALQRAQLGYFNWSGYANMNEQYFNPSNMQQFFLPVQRLTFGKGGVPGLYSNLFKNSGPTLTDLYGHGFAPGFGAKPVALFSDGQCFSACSEFSMTLNVRFGMPVVGIGGLTAKPMAYSAAGGGFVSEDVTNTFLPYFTPAIASLKDAPKPFEYNVSMAMRFVNGYFTKEAGGVDMDAPIEFTFGPAKAKVPFTLDNVADPTMQYLDAAKAFFK